MEKGIFPEAPIWSDVVTFDGKPWHGKVDIVTASYPCQPFSTAGRLKGIEDKRHLWPHVSRIISEVSPPVVFIENVANHFNLGFEQVCVDLQNLGYQTKSGVFSAEEVGAPHLRRRLFALAYSDEARFIELWRGELLDGLGKTCGNNFDGCGPHPSKKVGNGNGKGLEGWKRPIEQSADKWITWPPSPEDDEAWLHIRRRYPTFLPAEPKVRRVVNGTSLWANRIQAIGNAVVPLAAAYAFATLADQIFEQIAK